MQVQNNRTILLGMPADRHEIRRRNVMLGGRPVTGDPIHHSSAAAFLRAGWTASPVTPLYRRETETHTWTAVRQGARWLVRLYALGSVEGAILAGDQRSVPEVLAAVRRREELAGPDERPTVP